jgi:hypothetical protein
MFLLGFVCGVIATLMLLIIGVLEDFNNRGGRS